MQSRRALSQGTDQAYGRFRFLRRVAEGLWLRGDGKRRIRPDDAGTRARRLRRAQFCERSVRALHVSDLRVRHRGAETDLVAGDAERRETRLLRLDRAGFRIEPRRPADTRA